MIFGLHEVIHREKGREGMVVMDWCENMSSTGTVVTEEAGSIFD